MHIFYIYHQAWLQMALLIAMKALFKTTIRKHISSWKNLLKKTRKNRWPNKKWCYEINLENIPIPLQWRHNERDVVTNHRHLVCLLNRSFSGRSKKTSKLVIGEFPAQRASNAENISIWWRYHSLSFFLTAFYSKFPILWRQIMMDSPEGPFRSCGPVY